MTGLRLLIPILAAGAIYAQQQPPPAATEPEVEAPISRSVVQYVIAPVLVTDKAGNIIDGLRPNQFRLYDNGKEQNINVDVSFQPISLVLAIENSDRTEAILPQIKHLGSLLPQLVSDQGQVAVVAFDSRVRVMQDFTNDQDKVKVAINKINAGTSSSRMIDAVDKGVFMLRHQPKDNRKIILLVSETRDGSSETRLREALLDAQLSNILIYTVNITQFAVRLSEKPMPPRPDPILPSMRNLPMGVPNTPTTVAQVYGVGARAQFIPVLKEIYKGAKGLFVDNPSEALTKGTGGEEFYFVKQRGLEDAIERIGQQIHSQYLISYSPNNMDQGGFHEIEVRLERPDLTARTRPGYYLAGGTGQ